MDNQDKAGWCEKGGAVEQTFVDRYGFALNLQINPGKQNSKFVPDLLFGKSTIAELKSRTVPFFQAHSRFGLDPQYAVTINQKDIEYYTRDYPKMLLYFWVHWKQTDGYGVRLMPMLGVWGVRLDQLLLLCTEDRLHEYQERIGDEVNATHSYVVSLENMKRMI